MSRNTNMTNDALVDLVDQLLSHGGENQWIEFKMNASSPERIGKYCSALSNGARLQDKNRGYCIWGIEDGTNNILGTKFNPFKATKGNQVLQLWLNSKITPSTNIVFHEVNHPKGRLVLMEVSAASGIPTRFENQAYVRIGSSTPLLSTNNALERRLIEKLTATCWEEEIAKSHLTANEALNLLDHKKYFELMERKIPSPQGEILRILAQDVLVKKNDAGRWDITNLGAILFANNLGDFDFSLARKGARLSVYKGNSKTGDTIKQYDSERGYAIDFEDIISMIKKFMPEDEHIGKAKRTNTPLFPDDAVRELIVNALIHQDFTISGTSPMIEMFESRMEISNPGKSLVEVDRMIDSSPQSRNERLAALMRRMKFCEEAGRGIRKVISAIESSQSPPPLFKETSNAMQVILYGPRSYAQMTVDERIRACYQHACIKQMLGERMKNATLRERLGIAYVAQASLVIKKTLDKGFIKPADSEHPRSGYIPWWGGK